MSNLVIRKLDKDDDIGDFKSGKHRLDQFPEPVPIFLGIN